MASCARKGLVGVKLHDEFSSAGPQIKHRRRTARRNRTVAPAAHVSDRMAASATIFLDVDGVCHPLKPSGHPLHASIDDLTARTDAELELPDDATAAVVAGEFESSNMRALAACVQHSGARPWSRNSRSGSGKPKRGRKRRQRPRRWPSAKRATNLWTRRGGLAQCHPHQQRRRTRED